MIENKNEH